MGEKKQLDDNSSKVAKLLLVVCMFGLVIVAAEPVAASTHGCFAVFTNDGDGDAASTYVYLDSIDGDFSTGSETTEDSSCSRDGTSEDSFDGYIFDVPSGNYYLQIYGDDSNHFWGIHEIYISEEGVVTSNTDILDRGAVYATDSDVSSPRDTTRFQPGETATLNLDAYNGQPSGSNDVEVKVYVHDPSESPSTASETFNYEVSAEQSETFTPEFTVPNDEGEYEVTVSIRTDTVKGYFLSDEVTAETIDVEAFEPPKIDSSSPSDSAVTVTEDESTTFSVSTSDPDTSSSSLTHTWYVDGQEVMTGANFELDGGDYSGGEHNVEVVVSDGSDETRDVSESWTIEVIEGPSIERMNLGSSEVNPGSSVSLSAEATDLGGYLPLSYEWTLNGRTYDGSSVTVSPREVGQHDVELTVANDYGASTTQTTTLTVLNDRPELSASDSSARTLTAGQSESFTVSFADSDASDTTLELIVDGEVVDERQVSQQRGDETFSHRFSTPGTYSVEITATDGHGASTTVSWDADVASRPPEFQDWSPEESSLSALTGDTLTLDVVATDPDGQSVGYQWYIDGEYTASGQRLTQQFDRHGQYTVTAIASDPDNATRERTWTVDVNSFNQDPLPDSHVSAVTLEKNGTSEFATVSLSNPSVNTRTARVEVILSVPSGVTVTSAQNVQSGNPSQYQVAESVQPGSSTSLTVGLQLDDATQVGRSMTVDYAIIYYPEGQRADSISLNNSTETITVGGNTPSATAQGTPSQGDGSGFTVISVLLAAIICGGLLRNQRP